MSNVTSKISSLIKENIEKGRRIIDDKLRVVSLISSTLDELKYSLDEKIDFNTKEYTDDDGDSINYIYVNNKKDHRSEVLFFYYFHQEKIFPVMLNYQSELMQRCDSVEEVSVFIENLVSTESFIIKLILMSEDISDDFDDTIPF